MRLLALDTQTRIYQVALRQIKILSVLFLFLSGISVAEATPTVWGDSAQSYMDNGEFMTNALGETVKSFSCNSCHGDAQRGSLTMSAPNTVAFDATEVDLNLDGFGTPNLTQHFAYWQYQIIGGSGSIDRNVGNNTRLPITFPLGDNRLEVRYCLLDGNGTTGSSERFWNCGTETVTRNARPNQAPTITSSNPGNQSLETGDSGFTFNVATNDDTGTPTVSVTSSNSQRVSVTSNSANSFTLNPVSAGPGPATITVTARDSGNLSATQTFTVSVTQAPVPNVAPTITSSSPGNQSLETGGSGFTFTVATEDDTGTPTVSVTSSNSQRVSVTSNSATNFTLNPVSEGEATITVTARDSEDLSATQTYTVSVTDAPVPNVAPTITSSSPGNRSLEADGSGFTFNVEVDDDTGTPTVSVTSSNSQRVSITSNSATNFTLNPVSEGEATITVTARDSEDLSATQTYTVSVTEAPVPNVAPTITSSQPANQTLETGGAGFTFDVATEDDTGTPTVSVTTSNSQSVSVTSNSATNFTLNPVSDGQATITVTARDSDDETDTQTFSVETITVINNTAPVAIADRFVYSDQGENQVFDVLANDSDINGDELSVVLDSALSSQGITLELSGNSVSYQAQEVLTSNDVFTYRARDPLGALSDSVVVTLVPSDQDGDGIVDALDNCPIFPNPDQSDLDSDQIGDLCDPDGTLGAPVVSGRPLVEAECLTCHLNGVSGAILFNDEAAWDARIQAAGGQPEDLLGSVLNGKGSMPGFASAYSTQDLIQAIRYLSGNEDSGDVPPDAMVDTDLDGVADDLDNCPNVPNADQLNSDDNSLGDACEPSADRDGDGIPFLLDDDDSNAARLLATYPDTSNRSVFTSVNSLGLGQVASAVSESNGSQRIAVVLSETAFAQGVGLVYPGITAMTDTAHSSLMGIINLSAQTDSGETQVIIQLSSKLPLNPVLRVFDTNSGMWSDFSTASLGRIDSAPITTSGCPIGTSANYQAGLTAGLQCLRLTVQDGGANDADGVINSRVELILDIARKTLEDGGPATVDLNPTKSGGGAAGLWILVILLMTRLSLNSGSLMSTRR